MAESGLTCNNITDLIIQESGRFGPEIYDRVYQTSPWIGLVKRGAWPEEMGDQISVLTYERSAPTDTATTDWDPMNISLNTETGGYTGLANGAGTGTPAGGSCLPTPVAVTFGSTQRQFALKRRVLEGPDFCVTDLRYKFQLRDQLEKIISILAGYTQIEWENRYRRDYSALCGNHTVVNQNYAGSGSNIDNGTLTYPAGLPNSQLTQGILNWARMKLLRNGAVLSALGKENGSPVLTLMCSAETSDSLIFNNADIRQDLRWGEPDQLLKAYGVTRSYRGFYHLIDPYPRRFTYTGTTVVEVPVFKHTAATVGFKDVINPAWENALFEESHIFDPEVFHSLIPAPITNPAPDFRFDPVTYLGDWRVRNILSRQCNPDGTILYHRGTLGEAPMPVHPERGWSFIHMRCDPSPSFITSCS